MIYIEEKYNVADSHVIIYRDVQPVKKQAKKLILKDTLSEEMLQVPEGWKEYQRQTPDILIPYHHTHDYPVYTAFRQFLFGRFKLLHKKCKLIYPHDGNRHYVVVRCEHCGCEMMQAINTGECITLKQLSEIIDKPGNVQCENINKTNP